MISGKKKSIDKPLPKSISLISKVYEGGQPNDANKRSGEDLRKVMSRKKLEDAYGEQVGVKALNPIALQPGKY